MNPQHTLNRLTRLGASLTIGQRVSLVGAFVLVVALVSGSAYLVNRQDYVPLFTDLDAESAGEIVDRLKAAKVPYELGAGGRTIRVPENRADELRLELSAQGLPTSGRVGFEIFDKVTFGATEFVEQVNFRRALEGEIARTISTLSEVSSARVHIAIAKSSLFETREQPAKASVFLKLKGNRPLAPSTARGICTLVASSVEGLSPESVAILDSYGRSLARPGDEPEGALTGPSIERQLSVEKDLTTKLVSLLEPVAGPGSVRVNVAVRLNAATEEQTEERWDPNAAVIRSRQTTSDSTSMAGTTGGVAGSRANMPDAAAATGQPPDVPKPAPADVRLAGRSAETTNYEISHTKRHTIRPHGDVARMSVAVILDDQMVVSTGKDGTATRTYKPREQDELQKIQSIVASAVGIDTGRGDQLTVENVSFDERLLFQDEPKPSFWEAQKPQLTELGRIGGIVLLGLMAFFMFVRPVVRRALAAVPSPGPGSSADAAPALPGPTERAKTVADLEGAIEAELEAAELAVGGDRKRIPVLSKRLAGMTQKEPEQAARLVRAWLQEDRASR